MEDRGRRRRDTACEGTEPHARPDSRTLKRVTRRLSRVHGALFRILLARSRALTSSRPMNVISMYSASARVSSGIVRKPAEQAHVTALVGEIGADTAAIARHLATLQTRMRLPYRGAEEGQPNGPPGLRAAD